HEIRTPMNGLLGLTELAMASPLSPEQAELLQTAYSSGRTLLELLNNVLDLTRADAGKMLLERVPFAVRDEIETVIRLFAEQARVKDIALRLEINGAVPEMLIGDPTRLRQILSNLVSNAIKFTNQGGVIIRLSRQHDDQGVRYRFEVEDTGIGIPSDVQAR